jgi:hypothetical protein
MEAFLQNPDLFATVADPATRVSEWLRNAADSKFSSWVERQEGLRQPAGAASLGDLPNFDPTFGNPVNVVDLANEQAAQFSDLVNDADTSLTQARERLARLARGE